MDLAQLDATSPELGEPPFRARQVWEWMARGAVVVRGDDQPARGAARPAGRAACRSPRCPVEHEARSSDGTEKALFHTADGRPLETVLMRYRDGRRSLCLSSQSGCPLTCTFCATGSMAFGRNLTASEILDQALHFRRKEPVDHAVFMGMGEPLLNLDAVLEACERLPSIGIHPSSHHDLHGRLDPGHRPAGRARRAHDPPGAVAARARRRAALRADAGERALPAGRRAATPAGAGTSCAGARCSWST